MERKVRADVGIGFLGALCIALVVLRLCHVIDWPWWWVLSPIWIPLALAVAVCLVALLVMLVALVARRLS